VRGSNVSLYVIFLAYVQEMLVKYTNLHAMKICQWKLRHKMQFHLEVRVEKYNRQLLL